MAMGESVKQYKTRRLGGMRTERSSFIDHYRDLSEFVQPRRGRFLVSDRNKGDRSRHKHQVIINSRASRALRIATAGLFAGIMSPTRPWFKLEPLDTGLMRFRSVKGWLYNAEVQLRNIFDQSNLYNMAPTMLKECLLFATGAMSHVDDIEHIARFYTHTAGSYFLAQDHTQRVNTFAREFQMTAEQLATQFGKDNVSESVKQKLGNKQYDDWVDVVQFIEPNVNFRSDALDSKFKLFSSIYFEPGGDEQKLLQETGFDVFPVYAPRWDRTAEDVYGTNCPVMEALGDVRGLQIAERRKGQAVDKMSNPPLTGPPTLKNVPVTSLPGGVTIYEADQNNKLQALYQIDPRVGELRLDIQAIENRINEALFVDMFMAISSMAGIQPKNQMELLHRNEERLLQLGPVLEQLHGEFLAPLVDRTFTQAVENGILSEPPLILQGQNLKIKFVSVLAMAQRTFEVNTLERFSIYVGSVAGVNPEAADKMDVDEAVEQYGFLTGVVPSVVRDAEQVAVVRDTRAQQQRQLIAATQMEQAAKAGDSAASAIKQVAEAANVGEEEA